MYIAVTYENGNVFQHFGHTEQFMIYSAVETVTGHYLNIKQRGKQHDHSKSLLQGTEWQR